MEILRVQIDAITVQGRKGEKWQNQYQISLGPEHSNANDDAPDDFKDDDYHGINPLKTKTVCFI
jgi:hypothetical protein